jgi:hypothetical protein
VLEFVQNDQRAFSELARVLSPSGILLACFSLPMSRAKCVNYAGPFGPHGCWHLYGAELAAHFQCKDKGLTTMAMEGTDSCTGVKEGVHVFLKDRTDATRMEGWLQGNPGTLRHEFPPGAALQADLGSTRASTTVCPNPRGAR